MHTFPLSRSAGKAWAQAAGLALALSAGAAIAQDAPPAADVALTAQEFQAFVAKPFRSQTSAGKVYHVDFDDWMFLMNDKVMMNRSYMSKWGFRLGEVTLTFVKR